MRSLELSAWERGSIWDAASQRLSQRASKSREHPSMKFWLFSNFKFRFPRKSEVARVLTAEVLSLWKIAAFASFFYCFKKQSVLLGAVHASNSFELELIIYVQQWTVSNFHEFWTKTLGPRLTFKGRPIESFGWTSITAKLLATSRLWQTFDIHWS